MTLCYRRPPHDRHGRSAKQELVTQFGKAERDTGSTEVQIALLTERINDLTEHLRDAHARTITRAAGC